MDKFSQDPLTAASAGDPSQLRHAVRDSLFLAAQLRVDSNAEAVQVRVRNLSAGGLMAEYPGRVVTGAPVDIDVRGIGWVRGKIAWAVDGRVGISFDDPIDPKLARKPVGAKSGAGNRTSPPR